MADDHAVKIAKLPRGLAGLALALAALVSHPSAQAPGAPALPFTDPGAPLEARVRDLVSRLTLEEKAAQLQHAAPAIDRLGIPRYNWWNEALHGVARAGRATVFPQAIGLAASWNVDLMRDVATAVSDEARAKHHEFARRGKRGLYEGLTFWAPNINIFRDPRWGRGMETYGEDPYLAGRLAVAFVRGMQGDHPRYLKTVATPKHFAVHSGPESTRHTDDVTVDERDLRDTYLPQFEMAIREGGALSVMCAYNRLRGEPACASSLLLDRVLRQEWAFSGYVVSDCDAVEDIWKTHAIAEAAEQAAAAALRAGCDLNCGTTYGALVDAVKQGLVAEADMDRALERLFAIRFRLGMFDPPEANPYARLAVATVDSPAHRELALRSARESIVLLKNDLGLLPFGPGIKRIAVIGPNADDEEALLGNYNGTPSDAVTVLEGIRSKAGERVRVDYAQGADWAEALPALEVVPAIALQTTSAGRTAPGLRAEYFDVRAELQRPDAITWLSSSLEDPELRSAPVFTRIDRNLDAHWFDRPPDARLPVDGFAVRWTGELVPPVSGSYELGGYGLTGFRIYLDGELHVAFKSNHEPTKKTKRVTLVAGRRYPLRVEYFNRGNDARFQLLWSRPDRHLRQAAREAAARADVIVAVMGLSPRLEGEEMDVLVPGFAGGDRVDLSLPAVQDRLLRELAGFGKPLVLVLLNGSPLAIPWAAEHVPAIVEAWYPGQAAGTAIADVLFGEYSPAGRMPVTVYASADHLPPFSDYRMAGRTYRYFTGKPLFPFGHGLSYTTFEYENLRLPRVIASDQPLAISVDVRNTGARPGDEVVQLYVTDLEASVPVAVRSLQGFQRVTLEPGERRTVTFRLAPRQLSVVHDDGRRVVEPGTFEIAVGGKQPGFEGAADTRTTRVLTGRFEVVSRI